MNMTSQEPPVQSAALHCPRCGGTDLALRAANEAQGQPQGREYRCATCGTSSRMTRRGVLLSLGWHCDTCKHDNERGNRFCTTCGSALTKQCPNCGATMLHADTFCTQCGKSRGQLVAEWYRAGRSALDSGRPWDAVAPLQRLAAVDPDYGDIPNLLARALREAALAPPSPLPAPVSLASPTNVPPTARTLRAAFTRAKDDPLARRRMLLLAGAVGIGVGFVCTCIGLLLGSVAFGVLLFVFLVALFAVNLWSSFRQM